MLKTIALEATNVMDPNPAGISTYTINLINSLLDCEEFFHTFRLQGYYKLSRRKAKKRNNHTILPFKGYYKALYPLIKKAELVHCTSSDFINWPNAKHIITIHDLAIFKINNVVGYTSETFKKKMWDKLRRKINHVDHVIAVSNNTKTDIMELLGFPADKITVIYPGVKFPAITGLTLADVNKKFSIESPYFLFVGSVSLRKNILNILKAFKFFDNPDYKLVLAGLPSMGYDIIINYIKDAKLTDKVVIADYVSPNELDILYRHAAAFVFPTYYEGFGIPIVEAMLYKKPVIIGNLGSAPEIAGGFGIETDPYSAHSIAEGMKLALKTGEEKIAQAMHHAKLFTGERAATETTRLYKQLLNK